VGIKQLYYKYIKNTPNQKLNGKTMKREKFIPETVIDEDVPAFMGALAQAAKAGKKEFKFGEKTYKVNLKKDVADKITKNMDEKTDFEEGNEFTSAAAKAKLAGKDEFEFEGKTYPVEIDQDAAEKILGKKESVELERTNILTPDEYDEVSNFKNFNKKDWKWNAIQKKFVRKVKVKESTDVDQLTDALSEATASDYAKLSDTDLKDLLAIFRKVGNTAAKPIIKAIRTEMQRRSLKEEIELEEAVRPFKELEKAWIRAKDNDKKREKLIKKHNLKPIISNVRPGAIKLGPLNSLNAKGKQEFTMVGLDADGELIFVSNNPLRIHYPSNVKDRPSGEEMKESVSLKSLRIRRAVELSVNESISERLDAFITESNIDATWTPSKIKNAYKKYIIEADYQLYHPTFTAAAKAASDLAKKKGFEVDEDDWFNQVSTGPKKPGKGKTNRYVVKVTKKGKETKKRLAFQVYGMDSGKYELNAYVESTQIQEVNESTMDKVNAIVSDKQAAKIGGKMIDMQTASAIVQVYSKVNAATKKKMENEKIEKLVSIAQRVMAKESTNLEEASATVAMVLKALRLKGGKDADALIKKMKDLDLESKVSKAHADAAKKILKGQITKFVKESDKELDIKSLKDLIKNPSPKMIKQYGGKDKYIKMLKSKLAKLESIKENIGVEDGRRVIVKALTKPAALRLQKKLRNKFNSYDFNIDKSGLSIIVPNEKPITRFINKQPEVDTIGE